MPAPVINKKQKAKVIGKKPVKKKSVRNVLSRPKTSTWPLITEDDSKELLTQLKNILYFKNDVKINWKDLKNIPREQRKQRRKDLKNKLGQEDRPQILNSVVFGINSVMRGLEKRIVSSVLISADVNTIEMVKHIWNLSSSLHIPIIVVPSLRLTIKESVGFPTVIMGLKRVDDDSPLNLIYNLICNLSQKFTGESYPHIKEIELNDTVDDSEIENDNLMEVKSKVSNFYLYRSDSKTRSFVPPPSKDRDKITSLDWNSDFISFTNSSETIENMSIDDDTITVINESENSNSNKGADHNITSKAVNKVIERVNKRLASCANTSKGKKYMPVNVKRLQSNPNRKKK